MIIIWIGLKGIMIAFFRQAIFSKTNITPPFTAGPEPIIASAQLRPVAFKLLGNAALFRVIWVIEQDR